MEVSGILGMTEIKFQGPHLKLIFRFTSLGQMSLFSIRRYYSIAAVLGYPSGNISKINTKIILQKVKQKLILDKITSIKSFLWQYIIPKAFLLFKLNCHRRSL
jgi:hypothetical protein